MFVDSLHKVLTVRIKCKHRNPLRFSSLYGEQFEQDPRFKEEYTQQISV